MSNVLHNAIVVNLHVGVWSDNKLDQDQGNDVTDRNNANRGRAKVYKVLLRKEATEPVRRAANEIRTEFRRSSVPWSDNHDRVIVASSYLEFNEKMQKLINKFDAAVNELGQTYQSEVERARFELNNLFNPNDYPPVDRILSKCYAYFTVRPVESAENMVLRNISESLQQQIAQQATEHAAKFEVEAVEYVWNTVRETVREVRDRMADKDARFRKNLLENLKDLVDRLGALNIADDPKLESLRQDMRKSLVIFDVDDLRENNGGARDQFVTEADRILASI